MSTLIEETSVADLSGLQLLPWAKTFLDYTDAVVADIPEDDAALDWRPTDEAGSWYFSIREQAMHIADERHDALWLKGEDPKDRLFMQEFGGPSKPWVFRNGSRAEIFESLKEGRRLLNELLSKPHNELLETTDRLRIKHRDHIAKLRDEGKDEQADLLEARGPARIINQVLFLIAHEQAHRAVLQTMLRQRGHSVTRYA
jgi:hypothetical protein